jgi:hypothetical protein
VFNKKFKVLQQVKKEIQNPTPSTAGVQQQNSKYGWCSKKNSKFYYTKFNKKFKVQHQVRLVLYPETQRKRLSRTGPFR